MSSKKRRHFTAEKKAQIVRRYLADKVAVSDLADELGCFGPVGWLLPLETVFEQLARLVHELLLPDRYLVQIDSDLISQFGQPSVTLGCHQGDVRLDFRRKYTSLPAP